MVATNEYGIEQHSHRFAAWAASRAASVKGCRFKVEIGQSILEKCGFDDSFVHKQLPTPDDIDEQHKKWRDQMLRHSSDEGISFTHGVAAKLINCYLKSRFVCGGFDTVPSVAALHPPIDKVLLETLSAVDFGKQKATWRKYSKLGWSKFNSNDYEHVISLIKTHLGERPLWMIEEYWVGHQ